MCCFFFVYQVNKKSFRSLLQVSKGLMISYETFHMTRAACNIRLGNNIKIVQDRDLKMAENAKRVKGSLTSLLLS